MNKLLISFALFLDSNKTYNNIKTFFYRLMNDSSFKYKKYFDIFMIILVLSSVFILLYDVKNELNRILYLYDLYVVTTVFLMEYLIRVWVYNDIRNIILKEYEESEYVGRKFNTKKVIIQILKSKFEYMITPLAIIDLLAILPVYRPLRVLRVFVLFRLFKIFRYMRNINSFLEILKTKKFELYTLSFLVVFITFIGASVIYIFEANKNPNINSFFDAIYWSLVTISTVGYGDISPVTKEGRFLTMFLILSGIGFISFSTSIIASAFTEKLEELKENRGKNEIEKLNNYYIIYGYSNVGKFLADKLKKDSEKVVILDTDSQLLEEATHNGFIALNLDITKNENLNLIELDKVKSFFVLTLDDIVNTFVILSIRARNNNIKIISLSTNKENKSKMQLAGANEVLIPDNITALLTIEYLGQPIAFEAIDAILSAQNEALISEIDLKTNSCLVGKMIGEVEFEKYKLVLFGVLTSYKEDFITIKKDIQIKDKYFYFNPDFNYILKEDDIIIIMGHMMSINYFKHLLIKKEQIC